MVRYHALLRVTCPAHDKHVLYMQSEDDDYGWLAAHRLATLLREEELPTEVQTWSTDDHRPRPTVPPPEDIDDIPF